ncbi:MAG: hypothetical protein CL916_07000 [Deltaproteobacteria bacterium]|nr:hypothetical protein [Deltaproteobacteria bacterium]
MDPVQKELQRYIDIRDRLLQEVQEREEQLQTLFSELRIFEAQFLEQVGPFQQKLDRWKHRLHIMESVLQQLENAEEIPVSCSAWRMDIEEHLEPPPKEEKPIPIAILSSEEKKEAKDLYRLLARRFHPDLIQNEEKREQRREVMAQINQAYQENRLDLLKEQQHLPDIPEGDSEKQGDVWTRLVREIAILRKRITEVQDEYTSVQESELGLMICDGQMEIDTYISKMKRVMRTTILLKQERWRQMRILEERYWMEIDP